MKIKLIKDWAKSSGGTLSSGSFVIVTQTLGSFLIRKKIGINLENQENNVKFILMHK